MNWMISAAVAGAAGILIAPISPLTPITYTLFVVPALAAAVVGGFQYLMPTVVAGIAIGMLQAEAIYLAGKLLLDAADRRVRDGAARRHPRRPAASPVGACPARGGLLRHPLGPGAAAAVASSSRRSSALAVGARSPWSLTAGTWRNAVIGTLHRRGHRALARGRDRVRRPGVARPARAGRRRRRSRSATSPSSWGVPFPFAPLLAALSPRSVGVVVGLPALRLRGLTLGVVTLAFAYAHRGGLVPQHRDRRARAAPRSSSPSLFGIDLGIGVGKDFPRIGFGLVCLVTLVARRRSASPACARSSLGSAMLAVRANERSAAGLGVNVVRVKVLSFAIASFIAGLGGCLLAYRRGIVTCDSFTRPRRPRSCCRPPTSPASPRCGAASWPASSRRAASCSSPSTSGSTSATGSPSSAACSLILTLIRNPEGIAAGGHALAARLPARRCFGRRTCRPSPSTALDAGAESVPRGPPTPAPGPRGRRPHGALRRRRRRRRRVARGAGRARSSGLIGPNGAGKTSVIDAITGFARPTGTVAVSGGSHRRARRRTPGCATGLARTFQALELYDDLSVEENVSVAAFASSRERARRDRQPGPRPGGHRRARATARPATSARASASSCPSPGPAPPTHASSCSTSPPPASTPPRASGSASGSAPSPTPAPACCSSTTTSRWCSACATTSTCSTSAGSSPRATPPTIRADQAVAEAYLGTVHDDDGEHGTGETLEPALDAPDLAVAEEVHA